MSRPFKGKADPRLAEGMEVRGADAYLIGNVRGIRDDGFLLYRPSAPVLLVPFDAVKSISGSCVVLTAAEDGLTESGCSVIQATAMPASSLIMPLPPSSL
jgi:hypothetical protein